MITLNNIAIVRNCGFSWNNFDIATIQNVKAMGRVINIMLIYITILRFFPVRITIRKLSENEIQRLANIIQALPTKNNSFCLYFKYLRFILIPRSINVMV